jgi:hypothetical protein
MTHNVDSPRSIDALRKAHSITWSARASSEAGTVSPSDLAVFRLIASSWPQRQQLDQLVNIATTAAHQPPAWFRKAHTHTSV